MIVYLDTSALLKLIVEEPGSDVMLAVAAESPVAASCLLTRIEGRAALGRMGADGRLSRGDLKLAVDRFEDLWSELSVVRVDERLADEAVALCDRRRLRGYDAVQLAAARRLLSDEPVVFACFDADLRAAAAAEGFALSPPELGRPS